MSALGVLFGLVIGWLLPRPKPGGIPYDPPCRAGGADLIGGDGV
jgi:hypothetical protein